MPSKIYVRLKDVGTSFYDVTQQKGLKHTEVAELEHTDKVRKFINGGGLKEVKEADYKAWLISKSETDAVVELKEKKALTATQEKKAKAEADAKASALALAALEEAKGIKSLSDLDNSLEGKTLKELQALAKASGITPVENTVESLIAALSGK